MSLTPSPNRDISFPISLISFIAFLSIFSRLLFPASDHFFNQLNMGKLISLSPLHSAQQSKTIARIMLPPLVASCRLLVNTLKHSENDSALSLSLLCSFFFVSIVYANFKFRNRFTRLLYIALRSPRHSRAHFAMNNSALYTNPRAAMIRIFIDFESQNCYE